MTARTLMIQGTASHVGKSIITAGFCRLYARAGYRVAPFKAQNMSNNSFVTAEGGEMGRAQAFQAQAAGIEPHVDMNPILLKPEADTQAQVILSGKHVASMDVRAYHDYQSVAFPAAQAALIRLRQQYDVIVIEGAGSPAEINLRQRDIANMRIAALADAPVILVGDIERGGVFASLVGTMSLLTPSEKVRVRALLINKFRGDASLLASGLAFLEKHTRRPILGVLPYVFGLPVDEEDAVPLNSADPSKNDSAAEITIGIIRFPHISNATDFTPLVQLPGVAARYIDSPANWGAPEAVILPGTKSTMADYEWFQRQGLAKRLLTHIDQGGWVTGICGGYQMLGNKLLDESEGESEPATATGLGLLPVNTVFRAQKQLHQVEARCLLPGMEGSIVRGYEIHQGQTELVSGASPAFQIFRQFGSAVTRPDGAHAGAELFGTYLHGLFNPLDFRIAYVNQLRKRKGLAALPSHGKDTQQNNFDQLADWLAEHINLQCLSEITGVSLDRHVTVPSR